MSRNTRRVETSFRAIRSLETFRTSSVCIGMNRSRWTLCMETSFLVSLRLREV